MNEHQVIHLWQLIPGDIVNSCYQILYHEQNVDFCLVISNVISERDEYTWYTLPLDSSGRLITEKSHRNSSWRIYNKRAIECTYFSDKVK